MTLTISDLEIEIVYGDDLWPKTLSQKTIDSVIIEAIIKSFELSDAVIAMPAEICVLLSNDNQQQLLNKQYRSKDQSTNVLSFPQLEAFTPLSGLLGDIVLARQTIAREAQEQDKSLHNHLSHLVVHGFLHILGYDHQNDTQAKQMEGLETKILRQLGIEDPYES